MKNFLLFNQSFGTEGSPNQTGETLTPRDEQRSRIPLLYPCYTFARAWKYVACMLMVLVLGVGQMWGAAVDVKTDSFRKKAFVTKQITTTLHDDTVSAKQKDIDSSLVDKEEINLCQNVKDDENGRIKDQWKIRLLLSLAFILIGCVTCCVSTKIIPDGYFKSVPYKSLNNALLYISRALMVICVLFALYILMRICSPNMLPLRLEEVGAIGDFTGGVIGTLVAVFGAMYVVKSYKRQVSQARLQTFEATCATMLELHRQNVQEIEIEIQGGGKLTGRKAFPYLVSEYEMLFDIVNQSISHIISKNKEYNEWALDREKQLELAHKLSYGYFFYNVDNYTVNNEDELSLKLGEQVRSDVQKRLERGLNSGLLALERHVTLGHYYRHLYNMVDYIDKAEHIAQDSKDRYCKIVRSQLSDYEQILLYYNTLSPLGEAWNNPLGVTNRDKMCLIAKYRLLKNCPYYLQYHGIKPSETYSEEIKAYRKTGKRFFETGPQN